MAMLYIESKEKFRRLATENFICVAIVLSSCTMIYAEKPEGGKINVHVRATGRIQSVELSEAQELSARVVKLFAEANYDEALPLAKRVLELRVKSLGPEHLLIDEALYNLAEIYIAKTRYKAGQPLYRRILAHYEKIYGTEHVKTAKILERLAYINYHLKKFDEAEKQILRVEKIYETSPGVSLEQRSSLTLQIAELYRVKGDNKSANTKFLRALELSDAIHESPKAGTESLSKKIFDRYVCFLYETNGEAEARKIEERLFEERNKESKKGIVVEGEVLNGKALFLPKPPYPPDAIAKRVRGTVRVLVKIDENGKVTEATAKCGPYLLRGAAVIAAYSAEFSPTLLNGKPVKVVGIINYNFGFEVR